MHQLHQPSPIQPSATPLPRDPVFSRVSCSQNSDILRPLNDVVPTRVGMSVWADAWMVNVKWMDGWMGGWMGALALGFGLALALALALALGLGPVFALVLIPRLGTWGSPSMPLKKSWGLRITVEGLDSCSQVSQLYLAKNVT